MNLLDIKLTDSLGVTLKDCSLYRGVANYYNWGQHGGFKLQLGQIIIWQQFRNWSTVKVAGHHI